MTRISKSLTLISLPTAMAALVACGSHNVDRNEPGEKQPEQVTPTSQEPKPIPMPDCVTAYKPSPVALPIPTVPPSSSPTPAPRVSRFLKNVSCEGGTPTRAALAENAAMSGGFRVQLLGKDEVLVRRQNRWTWTGGISAAKALTRTSETTVTNASGLALAKAVVESETAVRVESVASSIAGSFTAGTAEEPGVTTVHALGHTETWAFRDPTPRLTELSFANGFDAAGFIEVLRRTPGTGVPPWAEPALALSVPPLPIGLPPEAKAMRNVVHALGYTLNSVLSPSERIAVSFNADTSLVVSNTRLTFEGTTPASKTFLGTVPDAMKERAYDAALCGAGKAVRTFK